VFFKYKGKEYSVEKALTRPYFATRRSAEDQISFVFFSKIQVSELRLFVSYTLDKIDLSSRVSHFLKSFTS
jgi:hypothetical protein